MPAINTDNPVCETCGAFTTFNKTLPSGARQYRCRRHTPNFTCTDSDRPAHRPTIGDRVMTGYERLKKCRAKKKKVKLVKAK